jgi:glycosyltransferase involved in cell wall biosynthesis
VPLISVIIPTFNRANLIAATVQSALTQDFSDFEIIVIDDGSTDSTPQVLSQFADRIKVIRRENKGLGASRNLGLTHATGKYAALLDDDDLWFPWTLRTYAAAIEQYKNPWLISSRGIEFAHGGAIPQIQPGPLKTRYFKDFFASHGPSYWVTPSGALCRADDARKAGGFFEFNTGQEENDLWLRLGDRDGFVIIDDPPCFARRVHAANISSFSNRNLLGTKYVIAQEQRGAYPGGDDRRYERLDILTSHIRGVSLDCIRKGQQREGWNLYHKTLLWHLRLARWRYLLAFPVLSLWSQLLPRSKR